MFRDAEPQESLPTGPVPTIFEAIVKLRCINAVYNTHKVVLAPHIAYTRHGDLFIDAITVARNGMLPRELKLGTFKIAGLNDIRATARTFEISDLFEPAAERYEGVTLMMVEKAPAW